MSSLTSGQVGPSSPQTLHAGADSIEKDDHDSYTSPPLSYNNNIIWDEKMKPNYATARRFRFWKALSGSQTACVLAVIVVPLLFIFGLNNIGPLARLHGMPNGYLLLLAVVLALPGGMRIP